VVLRKVWNDPVWSKVIAGAILAAAALIYSLDWWPAIVRSFVAVSRFLAQGTSVPNWLLGLLALLTLPTVAVVLFAIGISVIDRKREPQHRAAAAGWRSYTSDTFLGLLWRWSYISDGMPGGLASFCPHCDFQVYPHDASGFRSIDQIAYHCEACDRALVTLDESPHSLHNKVERLIQQKLRNGTWATSGGRP
jgi:hypothetical protein